MIIASLPDEELYARYARSREPAALELLVARWHQPAYRLARFSCRDGNLAEEAVQDAFLRLSSLRAPFQDRGPGSFRAWFLGLLANSACAVRRSELRALKKRALDPRALALRKGGQGGAEPVAEELLAWLGQSLAGLEDVWRIPLLLHYVEGLQQREVAQALGISQQMVSRRVRQGLGLLRRRLSEAGLAATVSPESLAALGTLGALGARLGEKLQVPADGCARVLARCAGGTADESLGPAAERAITGPGLASAAKGLRTGRAWSGTASSAAKWLVASGALGLTALALLVGQEFRTGARPATLPAADSAVVAGPERPRTGRGIHRTWDFRLAPAPDLTLLQGKWRWVKGQGMETTSRQSVHALLPLETVEFPLRAEFTVTPLHGGPTNLNIYLGNGHFIHPYHTWLGDSVLPKKADFEVVVYLASDQTVAFDHGALFSLQAYHEAHPKARLSLAFRNAIVRRFSLHSITRKEIPASEEALERFKLARGPSLPRPAYWFQK